MCGICGILEFGKEDIVSEELLKKMSSTLTHRGPDDEGIYMNKGDSPRVGLGHRRLSIIDLKTGHQPIFNEDKTISVVQNGEIYNFKDLRKDLEKKGHKFYTNSDTEVIVHLYESYHLDFLKYLRGPFALALWDQRNERLILARDRIGKKPLYWTIQNDCLIFASEIKAIFEVPNIKKEVNLEAIHHYLARQYIPSPLTIFKGIFKLQPASILTWEKGNLKIEKYWALDYTKKIKITEAEAKERIIEELKEATEFRLISDVPLGTFLSGGIDSSAVVAMASLLSSKPVETFSIGFEEQDFSELKYARIVAEKYRTQHHELIVKPPNIPELLPKLAWYYNEPYADSSAIPTYYVSKMTREYVTVALNGDGGDENFAGYPRYQEIKLVEELAGLYRLVPNFLQKKLEPHIEKNARKSNFWRKFKWLSKSSHNTAEERYMRFMTVFPNDYKEKLYTDFMKKELGDLDSIAFLVDAYNKTKANNIIEKVVGGDIATYLADCLCVKMDIASMSNSLEARSPFLDYKFMEFSASLPVNFKLNGWTTKYLLKKALLPYLPKEVLYRKKMGFGVPIVHWFKGELKDYLYDVLLSKKAKSRGYFNMEYVQQLLDEHCQGRINHSSRLWTLLMLEIWHQVFID